MPVALAVHGGAYEIPDDEVVAHRHGCEAALAAGIEVLESGGSAVDGVVAAVSSMESSGVFDAGSGSMLDEDGGVSLDAGIMDGASLGTGSVAAVSGVPNAIVLARAVLDSPLAVVVGPGAHRFAERAGVETCPPEQLVSEREHKRWTDTPKQSDAWAKAMFGDTVGAVALDSAGRLAAGTSTGGSPGKPQGRVGDSPFIGCGLFADDRSAAVSVTGHGEKLIPLLWAKAIADLAGAGMTAPEAMHEAIDLLARNSSKAGAIVVDPTGRVGVEWNTARMAFAYRDAFSDEVASGPRL